MSIPSARGHCSVHRALFIREIHQLLGSKLTTLGASKNSQCLLLTRLDTCSGDDFPAHRASGSTTVWGLSEYPFHEHGIPRNSAYHQGIHFPAKEVQERAHGRGIPWSYCTLHRAGAAGQAGYWNGLWKVQLKCPFRGSVL